MKNFFKLFKKGEKGQVLVIVALTFTMLVAIIGLAIDMGYMYVSYARLHRAVDAAVLAGTGEFKRNYDAARLQYAAQQVLYMNLNGSSTSDTNDFPVIKFETCDTLAADNGFFDQYGKPDVKNHLDDLIAIDHSLNAGSEVCTDPLKKIVRGTVREYVSTFFLALVGIDRYPLEVKSLSEAATIDVVLAIDTSESMTWGWNNERQLDDRDPSQCNLYNSCSPFIDVKNAASTFIDNLYLPYDRVGVVTFSHDAELILPLSDELGDVLDAIDGLQVFDGNQECPYRFEQQNGDRSTYTANYSAAVNPCRLYHDGTSGLSYVANGYIGFDCPAFYGNTPDAAACSTTNTSDGIALGGSILTGDYSSAASYYPVPAGGWPAKREDSLWVLLLLTDGAANSGHDSNGARLCPPSENTYTWWAAHPLCRDADTLARHCWNSTDDCMSATYPVGSYTPVLSHSLYDGDDRARDMFDVVSKNNTLIFTIGMGSQTPISNSKYDLNGNAPGVVLLQYGAFGTVYDQKPNSGALKGLYYYGNNAADLTRIFLKIANNLAIRINQ